MELIGMLDSPYVRRAAISLRLLGIPFEHRELSVFRNFDEFQRINPMVKAPTLVLDDGSMLTESGLIIDWAQARSNRRALMPTDPVDHQRALRLIGMALAASEKSVQIVYERKRTKEKQDDGWVARVSGQLHAACAQLDHELTGIDSWLFGTQPGQADVTVAVAWGFTQLETPDVISADAYPNVRAFAERAEQHPDFAALPPV